MEILKQNQQYQILVSRDELRLIGRCMLQGMNLGEQEFEARAGEPLTDAQVIVEKIVKAYRNP
jgi:hypothetical protein